MARLWIGVLALLFAATGAAPTAAVDLIGSWHVLIHYKDAVTEHPERERWEDRIWVFQREESRLRWIDYPIVVFEEQSGRFEQLGSNRASRVLHFWEPNAVQLTQIRAGLEINPRGSRNKTLRGSDAEGAAPAGAEDHPSAGDPRSVLRLAPRALTCRPSAMSARCAAFCCQKCGTLA